MGLNFPPLGKPPKQFEEFYKLIKKILLVILIIGLVAFLASCVGTSNINKLSANTYEIHFSESALMSNPATVIAQMGAQAKKLCPQGYDKTRMGVVHKKHPPIHIWQINCIK